MRKIVYQAGIFALFFANVALAHNVQLNSPLPAVKVIKDGELIVKDKEVVYKTWSSNQLAGKVRVVQHIAGRSSVKEKNEALMKAIRQANFDRAKYQTATIVNAGDAVIATGLFVKNSVEKGKLENPHTLVVLDQENSVKNAWGLKPKESFIAVLDKKGNVQFVSEGKLSPSQVQQVLTLTQQLVNQ